MNRVSILSYGIGNLRSVQRAFASVGAEVDLVTTPGQVQRASRLVLPGVGAFRHCAEVLQERALWPSIADYLASDRPFLGICVGMQLLMEASEEFGTHSGFGFIPGKVRRLPEKAYQKIPMVGWKTVRTSGSSPLLQDRSSYYFVHSFAAQPTDPSTVLATYNYGDIEVTAAIGKGNKIATQFHPEKSAEAGLSLLQRFLKL